MEGATNPLANCELFASIGDSALQSLIRLASRLTLPEGEALFSPNEPRDGLWVIASGTLNVRSEQPGSTGSSIILGVGETVGEDSLLDQTPHTSTATAMTACVLLAFSVEDLLSTLFADPPLARQVFANVGNMVMRRLQYASFRRTGWELAYRPGRFRREHDLLGERDVPLDARYGIQTLRAVENFPITGISLGHFPHLIRALAMVKQAAVRANQELDLLPESIAEAIDKACQEIVDGHWHGHFVVDVIQGGAGTSTNMNANEVIANRALELLGHERGDYVHCHPNNHVNLSQSTNDAYPTAVRVALVNELQDLLQAMREFESALHLKAEEFSHVLKMGRTQLQDAVPMTLGQEFKAFADTTAEDITRLGETANLFLEINLGGTAIGTGINADPKYPQLAVNELSRISGLALKLAPNLVEATPDTGAFVMFSGVLKRVAVKLSKLCNDLRLLSSGPRCGLNEINLPAMQPGSSIMPGKVNPVIPEVVNQVAFQVIGNDLTITLAAEAGQLQLNVMEPVITFNLFESLDMLTAAVKTLTERCIRGIEANEKRCRDLVESSIGVVTALVPVIGYERAGEVAKAALREGRSVREIVAERGYLETSEIDRLLSPESMTAPRARGD